MDLTGGGEGGGGGGGGGGDGDDEVPESAIQESDGMHITRLTYAHAPREYREIRRGTWKFDQRYLELIFAA